MSTHQHLCTLTDKLTNLALPANTTPKGNRLLHLLRTCVHALLHPPPVTTAEQRVDEPIGANKAQQKNIDEAPIVTITRITEALGIMMSQNPTVKVH
jgi:hypothetical protein